MSLISKKIKLNKDVLLEYVFDNTNYISENYNIITNLLDDTKLFISTTNLNNINNNIILIDENSKKYSNINVDNYNFLKIQSYVTSPVLYDKINIYFSSSFDFTNESYVGFNFKTYVKNYTSNKEISFSNFIYTINQNPMQFYDYITPFIYDEKQWNRVVRLQIPAIEYISNQRTITDISNNATLNTINYNCSDGIGISQINPIFFDFSFLTSMQSINNINYYYLSDKYTASITKTPEYTTLSVNIKESTYGDYFEISGMYDDSNEGMIKFITDLENKGMRINIEYTVQLFEENILTSNLTFLISDNFSEIIKYRPIITFSNTTALIRVTMNVIDLVNNSYIERDTSIGLTSNINKYGRYLNKINISNNVVKPKIYNLKPTNIVVNKNVEASQNSIIKVSYPVLIDKYKILVSTNNNVSTSGFYPNGKATILITQFDNVLQFRIAKNISTTKIEYYDLSNLLLNSRLMLCFKSDTEELTKELFYEANNNLQIGLVHFKILQTDNKILKNIYKTNNNFYLIIDSNGTQTQLYSGKYNFYENVKFV